MKITELTQLMHAVLDGEATPDESRELERRLAADPAARAEFDELRRLFDALSRVPQGYPPEGLVASVMASVSLPRTAADDIGEPFAPRHAIGSDFREDPAMPGKSSKATFRSNNMSEERGGSKRKIWIGGAIAAAAAVLAISAVDFPPGSKETAGTIVPAQRYRAPQPGAEDVKLGGQTTPATDAAGNPGNGGGQGGAQTGAQTGGAMTGAQTGAQTGGAMTGAQTGAQTGGAMTGAQTGGAMTGRGGAQTGAQTGGASN